MMKMDETKRPKQVLSETAPVQVPEAELDGVAGGALPDVANVQIPDSLAQAIGSEPNVAEALQLSAEALAHAMSLAMENATQTQGGMQQVNNTSTGTMIAQITAAAKGN